MTKVAPSFEGKVYSLPNEKTKKTLQFSQHGGITITVRTKACLSKSQLLQDITNITQNCVRLQVGSKPILVPITDLACELHVSKKILQQADKNGKLQETIDLALDALAAHVPFARYCQMQTHQANKAKVTESLKTLDNLIGQTVITPTKQEVTISQEHIDKMKAAVSTAYDTLGNTQGKTVKITSIDEGLQVRIKTSGSSLTITTLFGKLLAKGGGGKIAHTSYTLVLGKPNKGKHDVVKLPLEFTEDTKKEILQEVAISKKLNENGPVLGIQEALSLKTITLPATLNPEIQNQEGFLHTGRLYDGDLLGAVKAGLSLRDTQSIGYQMIHSVAAAHAKNITHGDIKLENYLFQKSPSEESGIGPRVYLADLAGAIDHDTPQTSPQETFSDWRPLEDIKTGKKIMSEVNKQRSALANVGSKEKSSLKKSIRQLEENFKENEKKADIFTLCAAFGLMAVDNPDFSVSKLKDNAIKHLQELNIGSKLEQKGWSKSFGALIEKGLSEKAEERPNVKELLKAYSKELAKQNPTLLDALQQFH